MAFDSKTQSRSWFCTINPQCMENVGLQKKEYEQPKFLADYFISLWTNSGKGRKAGAAVCVSAKGLYHMHMACYGNTTTLKRVSDILGKCHVDPVLAGKKTLTDYILKRGKYAEKGEHVLYSVGIDRIEGKQGHRNDLDAIEQLLNDGYTPDRIFQVSFRYRRFEKMIREEYLARRIRNTPLIKTTKNTWHFGDSGAGKTFMYIRKCDEFGVDQVYLCNDYANSGSSGGGFDMYANNPGRVLILDEFRGDCGMRYSTLLSILDCYSRNQQHCRYQNIYALWEEVLICSIYPPEAVYKSMVFDRKGTDSFQQLLRRLDSIVYHYKNSKGEYREFSLPASEYTNADDMKLKADEYEKLNG